MAWTREEIDDRLSRRLEPVLSSRRTAAAVTEVVCSLHPAQQERVLALVDVAAASNEEIAYQFLLHVPEAIRKRGPHGLRDWLMEALDRYDRGGMYPAVQYLNEIQREEQLAGASANEAVCLDSVGRVLETYVNGLSRRRLTVAAGEAVFTDGETLYLPERLALFPSAEDNFQLYKVMVTLQWAQLANATFRLDPEAVAWPAARTATPGDDLGGLEAFLALFPDPDLATRLFLLAEGVRLEAWLAVDLPGLARVLGGLKARLAAAWPMVGGLTPRGALFDGLHRWYLGGGAAAGPGRDGQTVAEAVERLATLRAAGVTAEASAAVVAAIYPLATALPGGGDAAPVPYLGELRPGQVAATLRRLRASEAHAFRTAVARLLGELPEGVAEDRVELVPQEKPGKARLEDGVRPESAVVDYELRIDGRSMEISSELRALIHTIIDDLGQIPPEYLVAGGNAPGYSMTGGGDRPARAAEKQEGFLYDEWDYRRGSYHKNWCLVRELPTAASTEPAVERALAKHAGVVTTLRRQFELLRTEERWLRRQRNGSDIDLGVFAGTLANIEAVDLSGFAGETFTLSASDVLDITDHGNTLTVDGMGSDTVDLTDFGSWSAPTDLGNGYDMYTAVVGPKTVTLLVDQDIVVV